MRIFNTITVGLIFTLGACATSGPHNEFEPSKKDLIRLQTMPTTSAIKEAQLYIDRSREQELDFLTPQHFDLANKALTEAKDLLSKQHPAQHIVQKVAVAEAVLKNGELVARKIKSSLSDELSIKSNLDELNASKIYGSEYGSLVSRLNQVIRQVEEGKKADSIKERDKLITEMTQLEVKSIKYNALNEPREILKRVKYRGGPELAPVTYEEALEVYASAEKFISENPHMREAVERLSQEALFAAKRLLYLTEEISALSQKVNRSLEQVVLDEEYRLFRVARALTNKDVRDHPLEVQSELIADAVAEISAQQQKQDDLVIALRDTLIKVRDASAPSRLNATIKGLKKEKNEWLAKDALYAAKISQLNAEIEARESQLRLVSNKLKHSESALSMSEMENQALSMTVQEQKQPKAAAAEKTENLVQLTPEQKEVEPFSAGVETEVEAESAQAIPDLNFDAAKTEITSAHNEETHTAETRTKATPHKAEQKAKTMETMSALNIAPAQARETVVDKSTTTIIANLLSNEPEKTETASINAETSATEKPSSAKLDPTQAFASEN